jgi:hypothetical protein
MPMIATIPLLPRLLEVAMACRDAFAEAAFVVRSPRLSAMFVRRAEHQQRIVDFLHAELAKQDLTFTPPVHALRPQLASSRLGALPTGGDPYTILVSCLRVLDTSILEFSRAFGPALPLAQRVSLERHHDQMRWSRDELVEVRRACRAPRRVLTHDPQGERHPVRSDVWFGSADDAPALEDRWFS